MKKFISFLVLASSVAFVSCKKEAPDFTTENGGDGKDVKYVEMTFGANIEEADSNAAPESGADVKATLDPNDCHIVLWEKDDNLNVFAENTAATVAYAGTAVSRIDTGSSTKVAYFKGEVPESTEGYYCTVIKKYSDNLKFTPLGYRDDKGNAADAGSFNMSIPEEQRPVLGGIQPGKITMVGWCEPGESTYSIYNTCGFIKVTIAESTEHSVKSITVSTSPLRDDKVGTFSKEDSKKCGVTISGAQRFNFTGRDVAPHGDKFIIPGDFRNSGMNYIKMLPVSTAGDATIASGTYFLVASPATGNGQKTNLSAEFFVTVEDAAGNKALLHANGLKIYRNKILALPAIEPDKLNWVDCSSYALVSHVSDFTATADNKDEISVSGTLNVFQNTNTNLISAINWTILYKDQDDPSATWTETLLTGTGTAVSGTLNTLQYKMISGHKYSIRVKVNGGQCYSTPVKDVVPGVLEIGTSISKDGNVFTLTDTKSSGAPSYPKSGPKTVEYPTGSGYEWTFTGKWWYQNKKYCSSGTTYLGMPVPTDYKLVSVTVNNAESETTRTYSISTDNSTDGTRVSDEIELLAGETKTIEIQNPAINTRYYLVMPIRVTTISARYLYCPDTSSQQD